MKKYGYVFLGLAIISFLIAGLLNLNSSFNGKESSGNSGDSPLNIISKDYVKSYNTNAKTKITFPIYESFKKNNYTNSDFIKIYENDDATYSAEVYQRNVSMDEYIKDFFKPLGMTTETETKEYKVEDSNVECKYICKNYKVYNLDNSLYYNVFNIFIETSENDVAVISYHLNNKEIEKSLINNLIKNIEISNDASYTIGKIENDKLIIDLEMEKNFDISVTLDSNIYEEVEESNNTSKKTHIKNKNTGSIITISLRQRELAKTMEGDVDTYHSFNNPGSNRITKKIEDKEFYEYDLYIKKSYAYIISNDVAVLIEPENGEVDLNDFLDIIIKGKNKSNNKEPNK